MKVEITRRGVYDKKGKPIEVGKSITVEGDKMPAWLIGKAIEVGAKKKAAVTNPAEGGGEQAQAGDDTVAAGA